MGKSKAVYSLKLHALLNVSYIYFLQRVKYKRQFYHINKFWQDIH